MSKPKYYWIKERHNPQLGTYYIPYGNISTERAKKMEKPLYGNNFMLRFDSHKEYEAEIERLKREGEMVGKEIDINGKTEEKIMKVFETWKHRGVQYLAIFNGTGFVIIDDVGNNYGAWINIENFKKGQRENEDLRISSYKCLQSVFGS